jgi:hypothetical protein
MNSIIVIWNFVKEYGLTALFILAIIAVLLKLVNILLDEDKSSEFRAKIYHTFFKVSGRRDQENRYISNDVNSRLNRARKKLNYTTAILPRAINIEWVNGPNEESYNIKEGEFVVCLDSSESQERNIVRLASTITKNTSLFGLNKVLDEDTKEIIFLNITKNILSAIKEHKAFDYFFSEEYRPLVNLNDQRKMVNRKIVEIDERGIFTRVLLSELHDFSEKIYSLEPRPYMLGEVEKLIDFLYQIANKEYHQDVPLMLELAHIRTSIILVADTSKILSSGIEPYVKCAIRKSEKQLYSIYVIIWDKDHLGKYDKEAAEQYKNEVEELDKQILMKIRVKKIFEEYYRIVDTYGNKRNAKMIKYYFIDKEESEI